jgi:hypothetical protein
MSQWHATADGSLFEAGTVIRVHSDHRVLRLVTADELAVEDHSGQRENAVIVNREMDALTLGLRDGSIVRLTLKADLSLPAVASSATFSEQSWVVGAPSSNPGRRDIN